MGTTIYTINCGTCAFRDVSGYTVPCCSCRPGHTCYKPTPEAAQHLISTSTTEATKHDTGKPRYDLIPPEALDGLARLFAIGAEKYEARNWEKGMAWGRVYRALLSHANKWSSGQNYDAADGQHHLLSVIWCAMVLYTYQARSIGTDDRPRGVAFEEAERFWSNKGEARV